MGFAGASPALVRLGSVMTWLVLSVPLGCEDDVVQNEAISVKPPAGYVPPDKRARQGQGGGSESEQVLPPKVEYTEEDFAESDQSRDPFRAFSDLFVEQSFSATKVRRKVILQDYAVDELKLIGIVGRIRPPRAMLIDPNGKGHIVERNDYIGKAERVQVGTTNAEHELYWRVDRIRDGDIVLIREDPTNPDIPTATRVLNLRPDEERRE